jgi:hypothetical protein
VKGDPHRIVGVYVLGQAETRQILSSLLGLESSEQAIPNDKRAGVIAIDAAWVRSVVYPMMRGCIQHHFKWAERAHQLGMDPELIQEADGLHGQHHHWPEA